MSLANGLKRFESSHGNIIAYDMTPSVDQYHIILTKTGRDLLEMLVSRGLNTWDAAPAELKELGDILTSSQVLQDYVAQSSPS